ncbi:MAG TPA: hypothetical protein VM096_16170 [Vicinamibacterales bacterium]|nr:hypothetical protein [Vicinamibacterales bacterium]
MAIVFTLCALYVAYCLGTNPAGPFTTPDSFHYLNATPIVPLGYPFFLKIFGARGAIVAQPILFGAALAFLGREIVRFTRRTWLAAAVVIGSMALPQIRDFHASILSESLFLSLLILFLALSVRFAYHPTWHWMVLIATAAGLGATVRRTAFALLPVMLLMVLFQRHKLRGSQPALFFVAAVAPFLVIIGAEQATAPVVHGGASSSLMGRHMFAKAALIDAPPATPAADHVHAALDRHLEEDYAPIRAFLASAPPDIRAVLEIYYETCLQGGCVDRSRALMPNLNEAQQTETLGAVAMARIRRAPLAFAQLAGMNYISLWTVDRLRHPDRAAALTAFVASHRPMPFEELAFSLEPGEVLAFEGSPRVRYMQWAIGIVGVWTAAVALVGIAAAFAMPPLPPLFTIAAASALAAHSCLLLTAILASGFSRFTQGVWPAIAMAAVVGAYCAVMLARPLRNTNF